MVCEAFGVLPSQARRELENESNALCLTVIKMRSFAHAKWQADRAKKAKDWPTGRMGELVSEFYFDEARARSTDAGGTDE